MRALEPWHLIILIAAIIILFGGWKKMPDIARSFGRSARILKSEVDGFKNDTDPKNTENLRKTKESNTPVGE